MNHISKNTLAGLIWILTAFSLFAYAQGSSNQNGAAVEQSANVPNSSGSHLDSDLANNIRSAIQNNPSFSARAHNIQVFADNGKVTLRGVVKSENEKSSVETFVKQIDGVHSVSNKLHVLNR